MHNMLPALSLAYCRNALDGHWYSYDDSTVEPVLEDNISTRGAYILFYQRRSVVASWSRGSSVRGSLKFFTLYGTVATMAIVSETLIHSLSLAWEIDLHLGIVKRCRHES